MALIKSPVIASASGSLAGLTFSRNRGGMYIRQRSVPVNPSSASQVTVRSTFGNLATRWATLTAAQRDAWETYALNTPITGPLGDPITLTGQQMYVRCNAARQRGGLSIVDAGPVVFGGIVLNPVTAVVSAAAGQVTTTFDDTDAWANETGGALIVYNSIDKGAGINFHKGPYRVAGAILGDPVTPPTSPDASLTSAFTHDAGNNTFFRFKAVRADGRISQDVFVGPVGNVA